MLCEAERIQHLMPGAKFSPKEQAVAISSCSLNSKSAHLLAPNEHLPLNGRRHSGGVLKLHKGEAVLATLRPEVHALDPVLDRPKAREGFLQLLWSDVSREVAHKDGGAGRIFCVVPAQAVQAEVSPGALITQI